MRRRGSTVGRLRLRFGGGSVNSTEIALSLNSANFDVEEPGFAFATGCSDGRCLRGETVDGARKVAVRLGRSSVLTGSSAVGPQHPLSPARNRHS